jgi:JAB1/Mov34/MPN/PAD-1 ubiquitin protease
MRLGGGSQLGIIHVRRHNTYKSIMSEAIYLQDSTPLPAVKVHPTAIMSILNSYARRTDQNTRVIGTLMGVVKEGAVEVLGTLYTINKASS